MSHALHGKRSFTGQHTLLPASNRSEPSLLPKVPTYSFLTWTFGRGSVIWRIWPAVLLHTLFAAFVVYTWIGTGRRLDIPNVMLTVMGVVIGFVISYRAMSGYDRYWMGRTTWADVIRNARTTSRLIWYHVPLRLCPRTADEAIGALRTPPEMLKVMAEKRMALDLIEGFAVALKHHLRGELGIYYEDLYDLVRPLHDHEHQNATEPHLTIATAVPALSPKPPTALPSTTQYGTFASSSSASTATLKPSSASHASKRPSAATSSSTVSLTSPTSSSASASTVTATPETALGVLSPAHASTHSLQDNMPLLPASNPGREDAVLRRVAPEMIAFAGVFASFARVLSSVLGRFRAHRDARDESQQANGHGHRHRHRRRWAGPMQAPHPSSPSSPTPADAAQHVHSAGIVDGILHRGQNLPEEVLRCLSEWFGVLEERGTVPGTSMGSLIGCIQAFEASLTTLEQVLTTPLPFVYSSHIRYACLALSGVRFADPRIRSLRKYFFRSSQPVRRPPHSSCSSEFTSDVDSVVWLYLFLLPLQLVSDFEWHTVPAVAVGAFVYLGFVAAGEEIEQPFGYDDNDLDLDMFCRDIVRPDVQCLKATPCANTYFEPVPASSSNEAQDSGSITPGTSSGVDLKPVDPQMVHRPSMTSLVEEVQEESEEGDGL
ncbi:hypothetical protein B0H17DRAFT_1115180 [Mycena rosella]|uniref:Uncharacterized protein n=1 Tax=Mycena rosella TaxID=1033263 RepID=A0AAD7BC94_MYCRO|nr:hypothetical protein B0H17DRAFT_1115180 [Mycena rosella]